MSTDDAVATTTAATGAGPATVRAVVDLDVRGPRISRHLYGHFAEHLGRCVYGGFWVGEDSDVPNERGLRLDVVEALRALAIPNLRWPGGCFADTYHWRDGVGPRELRPSMVNSHWGDVVEDNSFGTHEFMDLCELLGTAPYVSANVGSGTVREAAEWIEYLTRGDDSPMARLRREHGRDAPWAVPFWGLGNEPWGCGGGMDAAGYAALARQFGTYSLDHGDNHLYRIAAGAADGDYRWTQVLLQNLGRYLGAGPVSGHGTNTYQAISFHHYTVIGPDWDHKGSATGFDTADYYRTMVEARGTETLVAHHAGVMDAYDPEKSVGLVLDEWGTWFDVEPGTNPGFLFQQNTLRDALVASVHLDGFHRHADRLVMANLAQTINVLQAVLLTDGDALVLTPTYHVFEMSRGHHDADLLPLHVLGAIPTRGVDGGELETFTATASTKDGHVLVSLTNLDAAEDVSVRLDLRGAGVSAPRTRLLGADALTHHNTAAIPDAVVPRDTDSAELVDGVLHVTLPRHSFTTVSLTLG